MRRLLPLIAAVFVLAIIIGLVASRPDLVSGLRSAGTLAAGKNVYAAHCASCHGASLEGQANWHRANPDGTLPAPPHDASGHTWHHPDQDLLVYIKKGGATIAPAGFKSAMPGFAGVMTEAEIAAVLAFIKSTWPKNIQDRQSGLGQR